ncbi:hypothetical protein [Sinomicrobium sp.]
MKKVKTKQMRRSLLFGSFIAFLIAISPYLFYLYENFPESKSWESALFTLEVTNYPDVYTAAWYFVSKFIPLYLLLFWFFTCKHWWYHIILIPICMYAFQLFHVINDDVEYIDETEIYYLIPIMFIIIPIVYFIRIKLFDKLVNGIDMKKLDRELEELDMEKEHFSK